jgi:hypothetical protein
LEICNPDTLRHLASAFRDLLSYEQSLDRLIELLQKDQLQDSILLNALDKTIAFYEVICCGFSYFNYLNFDCFSIFIKVI